MFLGEQKWESRKNRKKGEGKKRGIPDLSAYTLQLYYRIRPSHNRLPIDRLHCATRSIFSASRIFNFSNSKPWPQLIIAVRNNRDDAVKDREKRHLPSVFAVVFAVRFPFSFRLVWLRRRRHLCPFVLSVLFVGVLSSFTPFFRRYGSLWPRCNPLCN